MTRDTQRPFTPRDQEVVASVAAVFEDWVPVAIATTRNRRERRRGLAFEDVVARTAQATLTAGLPVSAIVLQVRGTPSRSGTIGQRVGNIRAQIRGSDLAGMLAEGEIGLLIQGTAGSQATNIAERVRSAVSGQPDPGVVTLGVASRHPGESGADGLLDEARTEAARERAESDSVERDGADN